jgi:predicted XRE-type DNA-binding protein
MLLRINEKVINSEKLHQIIDEMLALRSAGLSQQETAKRLGVDRTVVSKLETMGEVRKGGKVALVGFPLKNGNELKGMARQEGVDFTLLLTEKERWEFVQSKSGAELFNDAMEIIAKLRKYDIVIFMGSNMRIKLMQALLDKEVIGVQIGESPIAEDKFVDPEIIRKMIRQVCG